LATWEPEGQIDSTAAIRAFLKRNRQTQAQNFDTISTIHNHTYPGSKAQSPDAHPGSITQSHDTYPGRTAQSPDAHPGSISQSPSAFSGNLNHRQDTSPSQPNSINHNKKKAITDLTPARKRFKVVFKQPEGKEPPRGSTNTPESSQVSPSVFSRTTHPRKTLDKGGVTSSAPRASRSTTCKGHVLRPAQGISKKGRELI
jgi:hypothetical protein